MLLICCLALCSCSGVGKDELKSILNNHTFEYQIISKDTTNTRNICFFQDSLCVITFPDEDSTMWASVGTWEVGGGSFYSSLVTRFRIETSELPVESLSNGTLRLSFRDKTIMAVPTEQKGIADGTRQALVGEWYSPNDSFPNTFSDYNATGKFFKNPTFTFTNDSLNVQLEDTKYKAPYKLVHCKVDVVVVELYPTYQYGEALVIGKLRSDTLQLGGHELIRRVPE